MTKREAIDMIADLFEEPPGRLSEYTPRDEIAAWDSLGVLAIISKLDNDFGISLTDEEIGQMACVNDIISILYNKGHITDH